MSLVIRAARPGDGGIIHALALELARSHGHEADFSATPRDYEAALFRPDPVVGALIAVVDDEAAGTAIWHRSFSSFRGAEVMYLEDLSVLPAFRRQGIGRALLTAAARLAIERGMSGMHWMMKDWNDTARRLYEAAGAEIEAGFCQCRLEAAALRRLAG